MADDESSTDDDTGTSDNQDDDTGTTEDASKSGQADIDAIVQKRLGQARKQWEKEAADAAAKAKMTEADRLKAEKAEAEKAAEERTSAANARVIRAEAKVAAVAAGVKADRATAFLRVVDLDGIDFDDNGDPDAKAIAAAVKATLEEFPEFTAKTTGASGASGSEHGGEPKTKPKDLAAAIAARMAS